MEYILEELLRQRRALAALMTGEMPEEQESGGTGTGNGPDTALPGKNGWTDTSADRYRDAVFRGGEAAPGWTLRMASEEDGTAILFRGSNPDEPGTAMFEQGKTAGETAREWTRVASETGELPWAAKVSAGAGITETVSERMDVHWNSGTAEMDARALSRAVQRDARRYDGVFNAR